MKKLASALAGALVVLLPISTDTYPAHVEQSSHHNIDWD